MAASWTLTSCVAFSSPPVAVPLPDGSKSTGCSEGAAFASDAPGKGP